MVNGRASSDPSILSVLFRLSAVSALVSLQGCGDGNAPEPVDAPGGVPAISDLVVVDSIGIELGDSNYVFGAILDGCFLSDGRIALVDVIERRVSVFSGEGDFVGSVGRSGGGPGEFAAPYTIAPLSNGGFAVSDVQAGKIVFFDSSLAMEREITGLLPMAPSALGLGPEGSVIGNRINYYFEGDALYRGADICAWSCSSEPDSVYLGDYAMHPDTEYDTFSFVSTESGALYCTLISHEEYRLLGLSTPGDTLFAVDRPWQETPVTEEELEAARPYLVIPGPGSESTSEELSAGWEPDPLRYAAIMSGFDSEHRLWVKSGNGETASQVFDLYDMADGTFIQSVQTTLPPLARYWSFVVTPQGIIGWDHNPSDYPRVYILETVPGTH